MLACVLLPGGDGAFWARRLLAVSPLVEIAGDVAFLDVRGTARLHGGCAGLFAALRTALAPHEPAGMALASNRFTAEVAARHGGGPVTVAPGEEALFVSRLPLAVLPLSEGLASRLAPLGLETLGDLASLPVASVERRYGCEGVAAHRLARGEDPAGLIPEPERRPLSVLHELEAPADRLERLEGPLQAALERLCAHLDERGQGVARMELRLHLEDAVPTGGEVAQEDPVVHSLVPAEPENRVALLLDLLRLRLSEQPPPRPVTTLQLRLALTRPLAVHQNHLFGGVPRDAARRAEALSRLAVLMGEPSVVRPRLRPAHLLEQRWTTASSPDPPAGRGGGGPGVQRAAAPGQRSRGCAEAASPEPLHPGPILRMLPFPQELVPVHAGGRLTGFRQGRRALPIAHLSAPRRLVGGWWDEPWARDEYDLRTPDGGLYRVCQDLRERRWLLLAEVD